MLRREFLASMVVATALKSAARADPPPPKSKIAVGRDTTFINGPLDQQGYVDYAAWLEERYRGDLKPIDNANVALWDVVGPKLKGDPIPDAYFRAMGREPPPTEGVYFIPLRDFFEERRSRDPVVLDADPLWSQKLNDRFDTASQCPWTLDEFPDLADWLHANEIPLQRWKSASHRPRFYRPLKAGVIGKQSNWLMSSLINTNEISYLRDLSRTLRLRALLRLGEKRCDEAWDDLQACRRWGRLAAQGPTVIDFMVGGTLEAIAAEAEKILVTAGELTADQRCRFRDDLNRLPPRPELAEKLDFAERFISLDAVQLMSGGDFEEVKWWITSLRNVSRRTRDEIIGTDFSPTLRIVNHWFDRTVAVLRLPSRPARVAARQQLAADLKKLEPQDPQGKAYRKKVAHLRPGHIDPEEFGRFFVGDLINPSFLSDSVDCNVQQMDLVQIGLAMGRYRADNGRFPDALRQLTPQYMPQVPDDRFSELPLVYRPDDHGYLLYSVGINGRDDRGEEWSEDGKLDDLSIRFPFAPPPPVNTLEQ